MKKKTLEEIIKENLNHFDTEALPEEHMANFEKRIESRNRKKHKLRFTIALSTLAAAVIALVMILNTPPTQTSTNCSDDQTIIDLQSYYEAQQQRTIVIIEKLLEKVDEQTRNEIQAEIAQMKKDDEEFRRQIRSVMVPGEKHIAYEVEYYRTRQESLEYIQLILQKK